MNALNNTNNRLNSRRRELNNKRMIQKYYNNRMKNYKMIKMNLINSIQSCKNRMF